MLDIKARQAKQRVQNVVILAGLHVVSRDFSDEFPCSGIRVIHNNKCKCTNSLCENFHAGTLDFQGFGQARTIDKTIFFLFSFCFSIVPVKMCPC